MSATPVRSPVVVQEVSQNAKTFVRGRTAPATLITALIATVSTTACADVFAPERPGSAVRLSASPSVVTDGSTLYATTNEGELVSIDLALGVATLIGDAGNFEGKNPGWTGISFAPDGSLYVSSRQRGESTQDGCPLGEYQYNTQGRCAHLYLVDPTDGSVIAEVGSTGSSWISDIDFAPGGTLYGDDFFDTVITGDGGLVTLDPTTAARTAVGRYDDAGGDAHRDLEYGGLTVTATGEIWAVETEFAVSTPLYLFRIDPATGAAVEAFPLVQGGTPIGFGLSALEALEDGRLIAARARGARELYDVTLDRSTGVADVSLIAISWPSLAGGINGLDAPMSGEVTPEDIASAVQALVDSGTLSPNRAKSLFAKTEQVERLIERGKNKTAINVLGALSNEIDALVRSGDLTESEAAPLRSVVETLIEQLTE